MAVRALGRLEAPDVAAAISPSLADPEPSVRVEAANALAQSVFTTERPDLVAGAARQLRAQARHRDAPARQRRPRPLARAAALRDGRGGTGRRGSRAGRRVSEGRRRRQAWRRHPPSSSTRYGDFSTWPLRARRARWRRAGSEHHVADRRSDRHAGGRCRSGAGVYGRAARVARSAGRSGRHGVRELPIRARRGLTVGRLAGRAIPAAGDAGAVGDASHVPDRPASRCCGSPTPRRGRSRSAGRWRRRG